MHRIEIEVTASSWMVEAWPARVGWKNVEQEDLHSREQYWCVRVSSAPEIDVLDPYRPQQKQKKGS